MGLLGSLRQLDRWAEERFGGRVPPQYDREPPVWLKYGGFGFLVLGPMSFALTVATSPLLTLVVMSRVFVAYGVVVVTWVRRHRV